MRKRSPEHREMVRGQRAPAGWEMTQAYNIEIVHISSNGETSVQRNPFLNVKILETE